MTTEMFPEAIACLDNDKRYSTHELMSFAQSITGVRHDQWHLDVAADAESHWAPRWFSAVEQPGSAGVNGLAQSWFPAPDAIGDWNVWSNVPFSNIDAWIDKAWDFAINGRKYRCEPLLCVVIPSDRTDKPWWQEKVEPFRDGRAERRGFRGDERDRAMTMRLESHHLPGRIRYGHPGNPRAVDVGQPMFGSTLLVWRYS